MEHTCPVAAHARYPPAFRRVHGSVSGRGQHRALPGQEAGAGLEAATLHDRPESPQTHQQLPTAGESEENVLLVLTPDCFYHEVL